MSRLLDQVSVWLGPIRGRLMVIFVLIVGLYFVLSFGEQAWRARELEEDVFARKSEITELREYRDDLARKTDRFNTDQYHTYVEQTARRDLNLAHPGETVYLVRWLPAEDVPAETDDEESDDPPRSNWQRWLDFLSAQG